VGADRARTTGGRTGSRDSLGSVTTRLPLFPLNSVLVPGLVLPLHVFEPRYRVLVQALMALPEGATRQFGVIAMRSGSEVAGPATAEPALYDVGCTAELREVTPYADGRFDIVSVGETRFRLLEVDPDAETPYQTAVVELLPEQDGSGDLPHLVSRAIHLFTRYREALGVELSELPDDPQVISYLVAAAVVLDLPERQALLETPTTAARLRAELDLLRRERAMVTSFRALPAVELAKAPVNPN
jgi:Lon protease-like protein